MPENLEIIFNCVLDKAYKLRKANPTKFDGLGFWQPIKKLLKPLDEYSAKKWKKIPKKLTKKVRIVLKKQNLSTTKKRIKNEATDNETE